MEEYSSSSAPFSSFSSSSLPAPSLPRLPPLPLIALPSTAAFPSLFSYFLSLSSFFLLLEFCFSIAFAFLPHHQFSLDLFVSLGFSDNYAMAWYNEENNTFSSLSQFRAQAN